MASEGHAPTYGAGNALFILGNNRCPSCKPKGRKFTAAPELERRNDGSGTCPACGSHYPVIGGGGE